MRQNNREFFKTFAAHCAAIDADPKIRSRLTSPDQRIGLAATLTVISDNEVGGYLPKCEGGLEPSSAFKQWINAKSSYRKYGNVLPDDPFLYRGRGLFQLTFRAQYLKISELYEKHFGETLHPHLPEWSRPTNSELNAIFMRRDIQHRLYLCYLLMKSVPWPTNELDSMARAIKSIGYRSVGHYMDGVDRQVYIPGMNDMIAALLHLRGILKDNFCAFANMSWYDWFVRDVQYEYSLTSPGAMGRSSIPPACTEKQYDTILKGMFANEKNPNFKENILNTKL